MDKAFKKGQKVWVYQHFMSGMVCREAIFQERSKMMTNVVRLKHPDKEIVCADIDVFSTKQGCMDYIMNNIKVIPYENANSL